MRPTTRFALAGFALATGLMAALTLAVPSAAAQNACPRGFYACNINADGSLDPNHPGCCLHVAGFQHACSPGFYACWFNAGGTQDPAHPGCCLNVPGFPHVR